MESIYLPASPNIPGLKVQLLSEIFFVLISIFILALLLWYFIVKYRGRKALYKHIKHIQSQADHLGEQMLIQKIHETEGKAMLIVVVEYLERFARNTPYSSLEQLFEQHGFEEDEIASMMKVLYQDGHLDSEIKDKILRLKIDPSFVG